MLHRTQVKTQIFCLSPGLQTKFGSWIKKLSITRVVRQLQTQIWVVDQKFCLSPGLRDNYRPKLVFRTTTDPNLSSGQLQTQIKGLGPRAWTNLAPSACHGALLAPPPEPSFEFYFVVLCNREGSQQCPVTHGGSQFRPSPGPWPLNF